MGELHSEDKKIGAIGFLGAGQMARALAAGFVRAGLVAADQLIAYDPSPAALEGFHRAVGQGASSKAAAGKGSAGVESPDEAARRADLLFLATKPAHVGPALAAAAPGWGEEKLLVSIAAGVTIDALRGGLPEGAKVVRVMPNTPCLVGRGACCYAAGPGVSGEQADQVGRLLSAVGVAEQTPESLLDAVTGLSGSGPAFVYTVIEALADGGVRAGLPRPLAARLATQTVAGAAEMVLSTGEHTAELRDAVASPGGTTIAGLAELERRGLRAALIEAVDAAARRSAELGRKD